MPGRHDRGAVRLLTRTGLDWTHKYPAIASALSSLPAAQAYLDGELCGVRPDGTTSFSMIQAASDAGNVDALVYFLFDLLYLDGEAIGPADARHLVEAEQMRGEHPAVAGDNAVLFVAVRARVSGVGDQRRAPAPNNRLG
jgi:hypothetical protein